MKIQSKFYRIYLYCVCGFAALLIAGLITEAVWLKTYEAARPENIVKSAISRYISSSKGISREAIDISRYESEQNVSELIKKAGSSPVLASAAKQKECDVAYTVKNGEQEVFTVYLKKNGKKGAFGTEKYEIISLTPAKQLCQSTTVVFPADATVKINGVALDMADVKESEAINLGDKSINNEELVLKKTAVLNNMLATPKIEGSFGEEAAKIELDGTTAVIGREIPEDISTAVQKAAMDGVKAYSKYMQNESGFGTVAKHLKKDTEFYSNLRSSLVIFVWDHDPSKFTNEKTGELFRHRDDIYSCRVSFTQTMVRAGTPYDSKVDKIAYLQKQGKSYVIIDLQSPAQ